MTKWIV